MMRKQPLALQIRQHVVEGRCRTRFRDREPGQLGLLGEGTGLLPQLQAGLEGGLRLPVQLRVRSEHIHVGRWIVHHLREDHRPRRRQRPPRPPQMQRAWMAVPDRLLPRGGDVDGLEGQGDFDELLRGLCH